MINSIFTPLNNSVITASGKLSNLGPFLEEDMILFLDNPTGTIKKVGCNFGELIQVGYTEPVIKKSNRGRKKKIKLKKSRKHQGSGKYFNSQITFRVEGSHIRKIPLVPDKHSARSIKLDGGLEQVTKIYEIKVFRNGRFQIPGALTEDMRDIVQPLNDIAKYINKNIYPKHDVAIDSINPVMLNFKFKLKSGQIDLDILDKHFNLIADRLMNVNIEDIKKYLINLAPNKEINVSELRYYLEESDLDKATLIDITDLMNKIDSSGIITVNSQIAEYLDKVRDRYKSDIPEPIIEGIKSKMMGPILDRLCDSLKNSVNNLFSFTSKDSEKYRGMIIKVNTPTQNDKRKKTTIKVFKSGKINIDGANSIAEAKFIYDKFADVLSSVRGVIYHTDDDISSSDSEFSYTKTD